MKNRNKEIIIDRIEKASKIYKNNLVGKTFLLLFEGKSIEVTFRVNNFLHLCGVDTNLYAKDFYRKAVNGKLRVQEIGFSDIHPYVFADIKTSHLNKALLMLKEDSLIITNISTSSKTYKLGTTNLEVVFCFDEQLDNNDNRVSDILIPYTLRIEEISNERFNEIYSVDYVLSKSNGHREYSQIEFGNKEKLLDYFNEHNITNYQLTDSLYDDYNIKLNKKTL